MSWETTAVLSADTTDVLSADTTDVLPADTTDVLPADTTGLSSANTKIPEPRFGILGGGKTGSLSQMDVMGASQVIFSAVVLPRCDRGSCGASWGWGEELPDQPWIFKRGSGSWSGSCSQAILALASWLGEGQGDLKMQNI